MATAAAIYCRLSKKRGDERSTSTQRQEAQCRHLCEERGWTVAQVLVDDDTSAYSGKSRPGYDQLLKAVRAGEVGAVVAWHPDRLHRSPAELETFIDTIEQAGAEVATVQTGRIDLASPSGRLQARMLGGLARYESEHRSERTRAAHEAIAAQGRWSGGKRTFGYRNDPSAAGGLEVDQAEADLIRTWVDRLLDGDSLGQLVADANDAGVPTISGRPWTVPTVRGIITADRIAARRVHRRTGTVTAGRWKPIISTEQLDAVRRTIAARGGRRQPDTWRRYLLTGGLATCGACGAALAAQRSSGGTPRYICPTRRRGGCGGVSAVAERLEDTVALMACIAAAETTPVTTPAPVGDLEVVDELEHRLAELATLYAEGSISRPEWEAARSAVAAKVEAHERFTRADPVGPWRHPGALTDAWPTLPLANRRVILEALMERIEVDPATKRGPVWDPARVRVTWRL